MPKRFFISSAWDCKISVFWRLPFINPIHQIHSGVCGDDEDCKDTIIYVGVGISVAIMLVYGCCRLVKEPCFLILICPLKSIFYCVRTDVLQMKNRSQIYKFYSTLYPQMMHIDKEQQNTSQATTSTRSIENPVYTVSEELLVLCRDFQMTLKWYVGESSKKTEILQSGWP